MDPFRRLYIECNKQLQDCCWKATSTARLICDVIRLQHHQHLVPMPLFSKLTQKLLTRRREKIYILCLSVIITAAFR